MNLGAFLPIIVLGIVYLVARLTVAIRYMRLGGRFNSTDDWMPAIEYEPTTEPGTNSVFVTDRSIIDSSLESGETLQGFARGFFNPPRSQDWKPASGIEKDPLLIAVTSRRVLMFDMKTPRIVGRTCFFSYDDIQYLRPPKKGFLGTSGRLRLGLTTGREYQMGFLGPLFNDEAMREEQRLAAYLRGIAHRYPSSQPVQAERHRSAA